MLPSGLALVGSRTTQKRRARGEGVEVFRVTDDTWVHVASAPCTNPSFLALDAEHDVLHAVEGDGAVVRSWWIDADGVLHPLGERTTGGRNPAHLLLTASGCWVLVVNHSTGSLASFPVRADGSLGKAAHVLPLTGEPGPHADQAGPKPHHVAQLPGAGEHTTLLVTDKGLDSVVRVSLDEATGVMTQDGDIRLRSASGPRHLALHPRLPLAYVNGELDNSLVTLRLEEPSGPEVGRPLRVDSCLDPSDPRDFRGAEVLLLTDAEAVVTTHRSGAGDHTPGGPGPDLVTVFPLDSEGLPGSPRYLPSGGVRPRFATLTPRGELLVAHENSDTLVVLDPQGKAAPRTVARTGSPVCVVFT